MTATQPEVTQPEAAQSGAAQSEAAEFAQAVAVMVARHWGNAVSAGGAEDGTALGRLWEAAAGQGCFELGPVDALAAAVGANGELGRVACPLPVMDGFVASRLLAGAGRDDLAGEIGAGRTRVLAVADTGAAGTIAAHAGPAAGADARDCAAFLEAAPAATHVLTIRPSGGTACLRPIAEVIPTPGIAVPAWSRARLGESVAEVRLSPAQADEAVLLLRLGLAARALAAAGRTHELAVGHAKVRQQFGRPIGGFGAVQQRTAACHIDVSAGRALIGQAVRRREAGATDWALSAELAVRHVRDTAPRVQLGAQHTLAASGYFTEHEAPWLFRRVHADVTRLQLFPRHCGEVGDVLVETPVSLPPVELGGDAAGEAFRAEVRGFLAGQARPGEGGERAYDEDSLIAAMAARGWFGFGWPPAAGGRDATLAEQVALNEEVAYGRAPATRALSAVMLLGNSILRHGTPDQQAEFLPLIRAGKLRFCLGYSEPEAGSDLASLRTSAVRRGSGWVINGQKLWTTGGHVASHVWLATRTDPAASPRHAGITVFLVPMTTPGISVQPHRALSGEISCTVTCTDVRVPDTARVGQVNGGWQVITDALAGERVVMGGIAAALHRQLDDLLAVLWADPGAMAGPRGSATRARLGGLAATLQATRVLVAAATGATAGGGGARLEAPMAAVLGGELAEDFGEAALEILGPAAALAEAGAFEYGLRLSLMYVIGGGTNDIQRGLIARGLGLPR